jgi:hypothetical protein
VFRAIAGRSLSYEWTVLSGGDRIEMVGAPVAGKTDNAGPGKIGGMNYQFDASTVEFKALKYGKATVQVAMRNASGTVLATDTYDIAVSADLTANNTVSIKAQPQNSATPDATRNVISMAPAADINLNMIVAKYDAKGAIISSEIRPLTLKAGVSVTETLDTPDDLAGNTYKVFFWDENFRPQSQALIID